MCHGVTVDMLQPTSLEIWGLDFRVLICRGITVDTLQATSLEGYVTTCCTCARFCYRFITRIEAKKIEMIITFDQSETETETDSQQRRKQR